MKNPVTRPGIDPGTVRLVAQRLNHYATPGPYYDDKGDGNQKSVCRVYVVPNVVPNKRDEEMAVCLQNVADRRISYKLYIILYICCLLK
jgi:hypothetical protein